MAKTLIHTTRIAIESLGIYRGLLQDNVIDKLRILFQYMTDYPQDTVGILSRYNEFYHTLIEKGKGCSLKDYIMVQIFFHDNGFARLVQKNDEKMIPHIVQGAAQDLGYLYQIASIMPEDIEEMIEGITGLSKWTKKSYMKRLFNGRCGTMPNLLERRISL